MRIVGIAWVVACVACGPGARSDDDVGDDGDDAPGCGAPGASEACYSGLPGTLDVGACHGGMRTCRDDGQWTSCDGEVLPAEDVCADGYDQDCDGMVDEADDNDGDGYTTCAGDCCDLIGAVCGDPALVNPGAFEAAGNLIDDDCDGQVDNVAAATCDLGLVSNTMEPLDYARAIDLCQTATETGGEWGVISARWTYVDSTGAPAADQKAIRPNFGATMVQTGTSMAVISTGLPSAAGQGMPPHALYLNIPWNTFSGFPADWLAANGGTLPNSPGCPAPMGAMAFDPVMLELRIRVPTNAHSFQLRTNFLSAEYPEWVCSPYNDFFVVLLDSTWAGTPANPPDKNLATHGAFPIGVNLAHGDNLFAQCKNGATGCGDPMSVQGTYNGCVSTAELVDTFHDLLATGCEPNDLQGGGTGWLVTRGNVTPGEVITLRIGLWDTSDNLVDSTALFDAFAWAIEPSDPGTVVE
jgi:hypothetical protein